MTCQANECGIKIYLDGDYEVWIGPASDLASDNIINAHIIGYGATKNEAIAQAVGELENAARLLQETPDFPVTEVSR